MGRTLVGALVAIGSLAAAARAEPVEEWQVRGIVAALKDGYPQVRTLAASELDDLLKPEAAGGPRREYRGQSAALLDEARDVLREWLKDPDPEAHAAEARALCRLYEWRDDGAALRDLLRDPEAHAGYYAAESLARLYEKQGDTAALRELLHGADPNASWSAYQALARFYERTKDARALRDLLGEGSRNGRWYAAAALARLSEATKDAAALRDLLKDDSPDVRLEAAAGLARLGDKDAAPLLREFLKDPRPNVRELAADALVSVRERGKDATGLRELLKDASAEVRGRAAPALAHLHETAKDAAALRELAQSPDADAAREATWALVRLAQAENDRTALRHLLQSPDSSVSREAVWALGRLGEKEVIPALRELLKDPNADARRETALVLARLDDADPLTALRIPYEDVAYLYWARWLAHYWGGRRPQVARVLCGYLGRPKEPPLPPVSEGKTRSEGVLADIRVLREEAWEKTDSPWMREDVAQWWSWLVTQEGVSWGGADADELKRVREALGSAPFGQRHVAAIDRALEPLETFPSPLVRTVLVVVLLNLVAVLLALLGRRLGGRWRWLPLGVCLFGVVAIVVADAGAWDHRPRAIPWLLGLIAFAEVSILAGSGLISTGGSLRGMTPRPVGGRAASDRHAAALATWLRDARDRAGYEEYVPLPADVRSESHPEPSACADPAAAILARLSGEGGPRGSVLIEAPAGTGKSALLREVVSRALDRYKEAPANRPLPVLLDGGGDAAAVPREAGRTFLVLDGTSELGPAAFVNGPHGAVPLLVAARPGHGVGRAMLGPRWMTVEPKALDAESLGKFVAACGESSPPEAVLSACRGPDGGYLPRLVRMAMVVKPPADGPVRAADLYRAYFLKSLEGQLPAEAERVKRLDEASRWCLEMYWREGRRRLRYDSTDPLQRQLRQAGLLIAAGATEVAFADATMQSYLTAHGLAAQDRQGYKQLPRPADDTGAAPWDRGRVLLRAAADPELFRMCLATFTPKQELREWLRDELARWADVYSEDLPRRKLSTGAARAAFEADEVADSVDALGALYAGAAPVVRDLAPGQRSDG